MGAKQKRRVECGTADCGRSEAATDLQWFWSERIIRPKAEFQLTMLDDEIGLRHCDSTISKNENKSLLTYNQIASTL